MDLAPARANTRDILLKEAKPSNARWECIWRRSWPVAGAPDYLRMSIPGKNVGDEKRPLCEPPHRQRPLPMAGLHASAIDSARWTMQMHQIRYFLALCEERNFTRAARRCGVSQPSLTNAIIGLERALGGALFQRKPLIALTALGRAVQPYLDRIAQNAEHAREAAQALADVPRANSEPAAREGLAGSS